MNKLNKSGRIYPGGDLKPVDLRGEQKRSAELVKTQTSEPPPEESRKKGCIPFGEAQTEWLPEERPQDHNSPSSTLEY